MVVNIVQTFDNSLDYFINADSSLFFVTEDDLVGVSDGTRDGTFVFTIDEFTGAESVAGLNGKLFFDGFDSENGEEPFANNGTPDGTIVLKNINFTPNETSDPLRFTSVGNVVYFTANNGESGTALYSSDGTPEGTQLVADINPTASTTQIFGDFVDFNGTLFFDGRDEENGRQLWKSDGTPDGTQLLTNFEFSGFISEFTVADNNLYFERSNSLWVTDGTTEGTQLLSNNSPAELTAIGSTLYFSASDGSSGQELWTSDGTPEGTQMVLDVRPEVRTGSSPVNRGSEPRNLIDVNGTLYFTADDGINGRELWTSDGTPEGTQLVLDINEGASDSLLSNFVAIDDTLYFIQGRSVNAGLWQSNGTAEGTFKVEPEEIPLGGSTTESFRGVDRLIEFNEELYFSGEAYNRQSGDYVPALLNLLDVDNSAVYRLFNPQVGVHFYTTDVLERDAFIESGNYISEGESYRAVDPSFEGAEEVFRFFNTTTGVHLYTTEEQERDFIQENLPDFAFEGAVFNAYETEVEGTIPVYRFYEPTIGVHFYTPSEVERASVEANLPNYTYEGIAYYAFPLDTETV